MSEPHDITFRRMAFEFPDGLDPMIIAGEPEESYFNIGLSLLLPHLEPYLIRTMNQAKALISDPGLRADLEKFNAQEGQHYRQHRLFNDVIRKKGFPRLLEFEEKLAADYQRFSEKRSLRFNLAYGEGFEAMTMNAAYFVLEHNLIDRFHPDARDLFLWHLIEEVEHRTVTFDVYDRVCGGYFYRLLVGLYAQWHMGSWIFRVAYYMISTHGEELTTKYGGFSGAWSRLWPQLRRGFCHLVPRILRTYLPWYTPHTIRVPERVLALAAHYTQIASRAKL